MHLLLSLNHRHFQALPPHDLVACIQQNDPHDIVKGMEVYINLNDASQLEYMNHLIPLLRQQGWHLQVHGMELTSFHMKEGLRIYHDWATQMDAPLSVVFHPLASIQETKHLLTMMLDEITVQAYHVKLSIENLNELGGIKRPQIKDLHELMHLSSLGFTWDIGHEVYDGIHTYALSSLFQDKLCNIHFHDIGEGKDHQPFRFGHVDVGRFLSYLKTIGYQQHLVIEVATDYVEGNTMEEKIKHYIQQGVFVQREMRKLGF